MATVDPDKTRSRYLNAIRRILHGVKTQQRRILEKTAAAPKLLEGTAYEVTDLTGDPGNDLDYYGYELGRLRALVTTAVKDFDKPDELTDALSKFDSIVPLPQEFRNPVTHIDDTDRLDNVAWFDSVVRLHDDGSVEPLLDPRYQHHDAALELGETLQSYLRAGLHASIKSDRSASS